MVNNCKFETSCAISTCSEGWLIIIALLIVRLLYACQSGNYIDTTVVCVVVKPVSFVCYDNVLCELYSGAFVSSYL